MTTRPPVMYSQPWSPTPSTTASTPGVAHAEPFADDAAQEDLPAGRAVGDHVAGDDLLLGDERGVGVRVHDQPAAGQALAEVVVGVADEAHLDALRHERPEALSGRTRQRDVDRVVRESVALPALGDLVTEQRADRAVDVADRQVDLDRLSVLDRRLRRARSAAGRAPRRARDPGRPTGTPSAGTGSAARAQDRRDVESRGLPVVDRGCGCRGTRRGRSSPRWCGTRARPSTRAPPGRRTRRS